MKTLSGSLTIIVSGVVLFGAIFGVFWLDGPLAQAEEQCFAVAGSAWGGYCEGDTSSLELMVKNICPQPMALLYCFEQEGGAWDCQILSRVSAGETATVHSCKNTGKYKLIACEDTYDCERLMRTIK